MRYNSCHQSQFTHEETLSVWLLGINICPYFLCRTLTGRRGAVTTPKQTEAGGMDRVLRVLETVSAPEADQHHSPRKLCTELVST